MVVPGLRKQRRERRLAAAKGEDGQYPFCDLCGSRHPPPARSKSAADRCRA